MKKLFLLPLLAALALASCNKATNDDDNKLGPFTNGVFVVHEGNFLGGNATLSFFDKNTEEMENGVFTTVNSIPLGDVGQSMVTLGDKGYVVVNNSGKVEVVNLQDLSSAGTITGLGSPRYICVQSNSVAYISDLSSGEVTVFNPQTLAKTGTIALHGEVEEMINTSNGVVVAGTGADHVFKIDAQNVVVDSVNVGIGPTNVVVDANGKVWVMTNGGWGTEEPKLVRINPVDMSVELSLNFPITDFPSGLKTNAAGDKVFWANGGVYCMDISATALPSSVFVNAAAYKLGVDPSDDKLYVSDAGDFNSNGHVYRYQPDGTPIDTFEVGVIPGEFCFTE